MSHQFGVGDAVPTAALGGVEGLVGALQHAQGGFAVALMLKDLRLAAEAAGSASASTPMGARALELYEAFAAEGQGGLDFSAIIKSLR